MEYERYLKEVVNALETDPEFRKKLDNATDVDIRVCIIIDLRQFKTNDSLFPENFMQFPIIFVNMRKKVWFFEMKLVNLPTFIQIIQ